MKFNRLKPLLLFLLFLIAGCISLSFQKQQTLSLWNLLDNYGYKEPEQKKSLEYLCQKAGILSKDQEFNDRFRPRQDKEELLKDVIDFVNLTQENFLLRKGTEERWEVKPKEWMLEKNPKVKKALVNLGVVLKIMPKINPDVITVLGATFETMVVRMRYIEKLYQDQHLRAKYLVLLAGERKVSIGIDGTKEELLKIANGQQISIENLTETNLIKEIYKSSSLYNKLKVQVIDTPRRNLPRPSTETTTLEFIKWLKDHPELKSVLFVSNQPYVNYQEAVIAEVFHNENFTIAFQVVGEASHEFDTQKLIESIGSYIWAKTPQVVREVGFKVSGENLLKLRSLYKNNPLIFQNVKRNFISKK